MVCTFYLGVCELVARGKSSDHDIESLCFVVMSNGSSVSSISSLDERFSFSPVFGVPTGMGSWKFLLSCWLVVGVLVMTSTSSLGSGEAVPEVAKLELRGGG